MFDIHEFFWFDDMRVCTGPLQPSSYLFCPEISYVQYHDASSTPSRQVRLFNDPMNKREYVARCLTEIVGLSDGLAYQVMMQAHQFGLAAIIRCHQERAELYRDTLVEHGLVVDMVPVDDDE